MSSRMIPNQSQRRISHGAVRTAVSWAVFALLLITYWITTPTTVSYWDCPEYVSAATLLEIGHPPGNPLWMLVERIVVMLAPSDQWAAYAINLSSGVFTAFAGLFLCRVIFQICLWLLKRFPSRRIPPVTASALTAAIGSLAFGWCDSAWYSAVEAEVYAMSIFFTCLCVWLMVKWAFTHDPLKGNRLLVLIAYVFGLSLGVHQLNLLCIPALALVWCLRRGVRNKWMILAIILLGMVGVGLVLIGVMPSTIQIAARLELLCVNTFHMPYLSGVVVYLLLLGGSLLLALWATARNRHREVIPACIYPAIFLSGIFCFGRHLALGAALSAIFSLLVMWRHDLSVRRLNLMLWMLAMLLCGYGSYALIPVRGWIPSPANPSLPGEPFSFAAYQGREQYGGAPLFYGPTPLSKPLFVEEYATGSQVPVYRKYALREGYPRIAPDSLGKGYQMKGYQVSNIYTPELNCFLPRVHSRDPRDMAAYKAWAGLDTASMTRVAVSYALDSLGRPVMKKNAAGERDTIYSYRPTLAHNLRTLFGYQIGYMYFRYLMWNFCGRQNDMPSQGEVEHGNFITGITPVDNLMLGAEHSLPDYMGKDNPGRNRYFGIPLILGIIGLLWLLSKGKRGRAVAAVTFLLFFMSGIAIVIYLNQAPGEPRERDYSFLGSFAAYAIWIGFGALAVARMCRCKWVLWLMLAVPGWMMYENFDDHDRRGREVATHFAVDILKNLEPQAVIFVNGDNFTFPLWCAQEVLGVRRDVKVVNLAYMSLAPYMKNQFMDWREAPALKTLLDRNEILWERFKHVRLAPGARDTVEAAEMLRNLQLNKEGEITARVVLLNVPGNGSVPIDLTALSSTGKSSTLQFAKLMMLNIMASNPDRPIYWVCSLKRSDRLGIDDRYVTGTLYANRYGVEDSQVALADLAGEVHALGDYNDMSRHVYMDPTPAKMLGIARGRIVMAARRLMESGRIEDALRAVKAADRMGDNVLSFTYMKGAGDSLLDIRKELGLIQTALADSLTHRSNLRQKGQTAGGNIYDQKEEDALWQRGQYHLREAERRKETFREYREALPPRLRRVTVPLS